MAAWGCSLPSNHCCHHILGSPPAARRRSFVALCTYNFLANKEVEDRWRQRIKRIARLLGCYRVLQSAEFDDDSRWAGVRMGGWLGGRGLGGRGPGGWVAGWPGPGGWVGGANSERAPLPLPLAHHDAARKAGIIGKGTKFSASASGNLVT